jgi:hypothetical protein
LALRRQPHVDHTEFDLLDLLDRIAQHILEKDVESIAGGTAGHQR